MRIGARYTGGMRWPPVKLSEIVGAIEMAGGSHAAYLDRRTGNVVEIMEEEELSEFSEEAPEWEREQAELLRAIEEDREGRFVALPDKFDADEWRMMADFAASLENQNAAASLSHTIRAQGAFRRFKDMVDALGLSDDWFAYRDRRFRELAREWCEGERIEWVDDPRGT